MSYVLTCGSPADLSREHFEKIGVRFIPYRFSLGDAEYLDDLGESVSYDAFYKAMVDGAATHTSQVNPEQYAEFFSSILKEGKDVLHIALSTGITGTYHSACKAAEMVMEQFPERKVYVVDSLAASSGYGLLVDTLAAKRDEGLSLEELRDWAEENKLRLHHWFLSTDLTFYIRGGRISKAAGTIASALGICPLLHMDSLGRLIPVDKLHTKKKTMKNIVAEMLENADDGTDYSGKCYISHSDCLADAEKIAAAVEESFPRLNGKVLINNIGTIIGSHAGPGTVALFFWGKKRID